MLLQGKTAVVTGCSRGIGRAVLETFARQGADVWACVRRPDEGFAAFASALAAEAGVAVTPVYFDLASPEQVRAGAEAIKAAGRPVDILVNNAGVIRTSLFQMTPADAMREMFEINFLAQMSFTQYIVRLMTRQKSGAIVNVSSTAAIDGNEGRTAYAASKAALISATQVMARELGALNIRVNAVAPGLTQTDMMTGSTPAEAVAAVVSASALKRVGCPQEIANAVLFLSSPLSSYVTGQVLRVDGGL